MKINRLLTVVLALCLALSACGTVRTPKKKDFVVNMDTPKIKIGEIDAQIDRLFSIGGLKKINITVSYYPQEDAVCLQYVADLMTYYQFWSGEGRAAFISALAQYNEDYSARNLAKSRLKTLRQYNIVQGYLVWQLHAYTIKANANMDVELGYSFRNNSPYYTVNQREAEYIYSIGSDNNRTSPTIAIYFTRAQAEELAALFDQQLLQSMVSGRSGGGEDDYYEERDFQSDEY